MVAPLTAALVAVAAVLPDLGHDPDALVFRLTVSPAPVPAGRRDHDLLPGPRDRTPGNAALDYLRAAVLLPKEPRRSDDEWKAREDTLARWRIVPPAGLPLAAVKKELQPYERAMAAADRAARATTCDFQTGKITIATNLHTTDTQPLREVMNWLRLRFKVELAEGRTEDARQTLQTAFQMARHIGAGPTMIEHLVGIAFAAAAADMAAEWEGRAGSANLYWALAGLPDPFLDLRPVFAGEAELMANTFPAFAEFEKGPVAEAKARELVLGMKSFDDWLDLAGGRTKSWEGELTNLFGDFAVVWQAGGAVAWLKARGRKDAAAMPALQAVYLAGWLRYRDCADELAAACVLPPPRAWAEVRRATESVKRKRSEFDGDRVFRAFTMTVPGYEKVFLSNVRIRRQFAALAAVEAIRAHLALGRGLPKGWEDVTVVPVPDDPLTGKPFGYTLEGGRAVILAPPPAGATDKRSNALRYELTARP